MTRIYPVHLLPRLPILFLLLMMTMGTAAHAQTAPADFRTQFLREFDGTMNRLVALAEAMPEETYAWSPGEGVMSVARVYMHIARYNYLLPALSLGAETPAGIVLAEMEAVEEKARVVEALRASGVYLRNLVEQMPESSFQEPARLFGRDVQRWAVLMRLQTHMSEHYGQSIAYARMNGVVPPWAR
jgi:uncharacterized damage-inducible protein DinB